MKSKKNKGGRPRNPNGRGRAVSVYVRPELDPAIRKAAAARGMSVSAFIADVVARYVAVFASTGKE